MTDAAILADGLLHPNDLPLFRLLEVTAYKLAVEYRLALKSFEPKARPTYGYWGFCQSAFGRVTMVIRWKKDSEWAPVTLSPRSLIDTLAHELAHLRHFPKDGIHGPKWKSLFKQIRDSLRDEDLHLIEEIQRLRQTI